MLDERVDGAEPVAPSPEAQPRRTEAAGPAVSSEPLLPPAAELKRRRWPTRVVIGLGIVSGLFVALYVLSLYEVWHTGRADEARAVDAIVVLGAAQYDGRPSPQLAARLDHALALYKAGYAPKVFVTGGKQPLDRFTEAGSEARYLEERGVPASAILQEDQGRTTWESLSAVAAALKAQNLHNVLLVSDPYHAARIKGMASELGLRSYVSSTHTSPVRGFAAFRHMVKEAGGVALAHIVGWHRVVDWTE
jgi:uncharacterized SAM-binding protein YcdF (DUF218 family)